MCNSASQWPWRTLTTVSRSGGDTAAGGGRARGAQMGGRAPARHSAGSRSGHTEQQAKGGRPAAGQMRPPDRVHPAVPGNAPPADVQNSPANTFCRDLPKAWYCAYSSSSASHSCAEWRQLGQVRRVGWEGGGSRATPVQSEAGAAACCSHAGNSSSWVRSKGASSSIKCRSGSSL